LTTHGVHQEMGQEGVIRQLLWFYYRGTIVRSTVDSVDRILVLTEQEVRYLSRFGAEAVKKTRVVPIGVSLDEFPYPSAAKESARPTILYIGRIDRGKGLEVLVDAVSRLGRYDPQVIIVGARTGFSATLESLAASRNVSKNLVFAGFVKEETKRRLLEESMVFCLPSMYEGAGLVLLEAMAAGKPVVATNVGGIPHIVDDGSSGFLVNYGDAKALAERLEQLILNKDLRDSMGKKGREIAENYSWPQVAEEVEKVYLELK
jgi:glycosyltransferase involved in cell wall biosynthesis